MNAEIISIGTELLLGNTANTDARDLSLELAALGINVFWHTVVGDNPSRITQCVQIAKERADLILTTGGLGPTCDDLTKQVVAEAFGLKLYYDLEEAQVIRTWFEKRKSRLPLTENNFQQAWLPEGCTVFRNDWGTAPGCAFEKGDIHVLMLPGPPRECNPMFRERAAPYLRALSDEVIVSHQLHMVGVGESQMEEKLHDLMVSLRNPTLAPYAKVGECLVRVTAKAKTVEEADAMMAPVIAEVRARIGDVIYGMDCNSLEEMLLSLLGSKGLTLAAAESCTGGLLAKRLTDIPGASARFKGGVTAYTEEAKTVLLGIPPEIIARHGVVSSCVAENMAIRVREVLKADFGVGITGYAGPEGEEVGLVFIALAWERGCVVRRIHCGKSPRDRVRTLAVNTAFDMLRRRLSGLEIKSEI